MHGIYHYFKISEIWCRLGFQHNILMLFGQEAQAGFVTY
jgi:hypothetical protein